MVHLVNDEMSQIPPVYYGGRNYYLAPYFEGCLTKELRFFGLSWIKFLKANRIDINIEFKYKDPCINGNKIQYNSKYFLNINKNRSQKHMVHDMIWPKRFESYL